MTVTEQVRALEETKNNLTALSMELVATIRANRQQGSLQIEDSDSAAKFDGWMKYYQDRIKAISGMDPEHVLGQSLIKPEENQ